MLLNNREIIKLEGFLEQFNVKITVQESQYPEFRSLLFSFLDNNLTVFIIDEYKVFNTITKL